MAKQNTPQILLFANPQNRYEEGKKSIPNNSLFLLLKMRSLRPHKENSARNVMGEGRLGAASGAYFYAQGSLIYQLLGDGELLESVFLSFPKI